MMRSICPLAHQKGNPQVIHPVLHVERDVPARGGELHVKVLVSRDVQPPGQDGLVDEQQTPGVHHLRAALGHRLVQIGAAGHVACDQADDAAQGQLNDVPGPAPHVPDLELPVVYVDGARRHPAGTVGLNDAALRGGEENGTPQREVLAPDLSAGRELGPEGVDLLPGHLQVGAAGQQDQTQGDPDTTLHLWPHIQG